MVFVWYAILAVGILGTLATGIWFLIVAFRQGVGWGLLCFVPFGNLVVLIKFWSETKRPFLFSLGATALLWIATFGIFASTASRHSDFAVNLEPSSPSDYAWEPQPAPRDTVLSDDFNPDDAERAVDALFEGTSELEPTATPEPLPEASDQVGALPEPSRRRGLTSQPPGALGNLIGRQGMLVMKNGQKIPVFVEKVSGSDVEVRRKVGGGSIAFTIQIEDVEEVLIR